MLRIQRDSYLRKKILRLLAAKRSSPKKITWRNPGSLYTRRNSDMGTLAEFCNFDESRPKSELTAEINEAQSHTLLKTFAKSHKPPLRGVACFAPRRGRYCQRLNDAGFLFVQAIVDWLPATLERVLVFFRCELILYLISFLLLADILFYSRRV